MRFKSLVEKPERKSYNKIISTSGGLGLREFVYILRHESLEIGSTNPFTEQNDVYSFGILLMEIITGRAPANCNQSQVCFIHFLVVINWVIK